MYRPAERGTLDPIMRVKSGGGEGGVWRWVVAVIRGRPGHSQNPDPTILTSYSSLRIT